MRSPSNRRWRTSDIVRKSAEVEWEGEYCFCIEYRSEEKVLRSCCCYSTTFHHLLVSSASSVAVSFFNSEI
jgi:hypothetical protein